MRHWRSGSPVSGGSILITSAPNSARHFPAKGPAINWPSSSTRIPASGFVCSPMPLLSDRPTLDQRLRKRSGVDVFKFAAHGNAAGDPGNLDTAAVQHLADVMGRRLAFVGEIGRHDDLLHRSVCSAFLQHVEFHFPLTLSIHP